MFKIKIFISHSEHDTKRAKELFVKLSRPDINVWCYEREKYYARDIKKEIEKHILQCDVFLLLLTDSSSDSEWVRRELGLAISLHKDGSNRPIIIGVRCDLLCASMDFRYNDFWSGTDRGIYSFSKIRSFNFKTSSLLDSIEDLVDYITPKVIFITDTQGEQGTLLHSSFNCYIELFPDETERDDPADIMTWIDEAQKAELTNDPWREIYAVFHVAEFAIGMAYISIHLNNDWAFGNYFGVKKRWRQYGKAEYFIEKVIEHLLKKQPKLKGILFEIEPIDLDLLEVIGNQPTIQGSDNLIEVVHNIRLMSRYILYRRYGCLAILGADKFPLPYWQPAMDEPLDEQNEYKLILMVKHIPKKKLEISDQTLNDMLTFIYDFLYKDAYGGAGFVEIPGYSEYIDQVKNRVKCYAEKGWSIGNIIIPKKIRRLILKAIQEGFADQLAL